MKKNIEKPQLKMLKTTSIKPYWRNARDNEKTVAALKESIENYGFTTPILIDKSKTIIAGHARYKAAVELGYEELPTIELDLDEKKAKEYRIIDNKTQEMTSYIEAELFIELREIGNIDFMQSFFPDMDLNMALDTSVGANITYEDQEAIDHKKQIMDHQFDTIKKDEEREVICPACGEIHYIKL